MPGAGVLGGESPDAVRRPRSTSIEGGLDVRIEADSRDIAYSSCFCRLGDYGGERARRSGQPRSRAPRAWRSLSVGYVAGAERSERPDAAWRGGGGRSLGASVRRG